MSQWEQFCPIWIRCPKKVHVSFIIIWRGRILHVCKTNWIAVEIQARGDSIIIGGCVPQKILIVYSLNGAFWGIQMIVPHSPDRSNDSSYLLQGSGLCQTLLCSKPILSVGALPQKILIIYSLNGAFWGIQMIVPHSPDRSNDSKQNSIKAVAVHQG